MERITGALAAVRNPRTGADVMAADQVRDIATTVDGKVRLTLLLAPEDDATLVRDVRQAVEALAGVTDVRVDVRDPAQSEPTPARPSPTPAMNQPKAPGAGRALPVMDAAPAKAPPKVPDPVQYPNLGRILAISSGKGGVGKSTTTVNLALALAAEGAKVGILDADIYGPSQPMMMGISGRPESEDGKRIEPLENYGVQVMSIGFLIEPDQAMIWRGPMATQALDQLLNQTNWRELDYLLIDMPPGTGDIALTLSQRVPLTGAVIVTTPQDIALIDAKKGLTMFEKVGVPILGIVENMAVYCCPNCGHTEHIFGADGGKRMAEQFKVDHLGSLPLNLSIRQQADEGRPTVVADPDGEIAALYKTVARTVAVKIAQKAKDFSARFPTITVSKGT